MMPRVKRSKPPSLSDEDNYPSWLQGAINMGRLRVRNHPTKGKFYQVISGGMVVKVLTELDSISESDFI